MNFKLYPAIGVFLAVAGAQAADTGLSGPVSGRVFDAASHSVRMIMGVPGGAYLGPAIVDGAENGSVAPGGKQALVLRDGQLTLVSFDSDAIGYGSLGEWNGALDAVAWNGKAFAAAGASVRAFRITDSGISQTPLAAVEGKFKALAVDADGAGAVAIVDKSVYYLSADSAKLIGAFSDPTAITIDGDALYVADAAAGEITRIASYRTAPDIARLAGGIVRATGLAITERHLLLVADSGAKAVLTLNATTGEVLERADIDFEAARAESLGAGLFRLDGRSAPSDPVQLASLNQGLKIYFVPAGTIQE